MVTRIDYVLTNNLTDNQLGARIPFPSYTLKLLNALTPSQLNGNEVEATVFDEASARYDLNGRCPDVLCVTALTPGIPRAYQIADLAKDMESINGNRIITVIGGIHATCLPWEASKHFDIVVRGEVTSEFLSSVLTEALASGRLTSAEKRIFRLSQVPRVLAPPPIHWEAEELKRSFAIPFQGSTGCAGDCNFCSTTSVHGAKARYLSQGCFAASLDEISVSKPIALFDDNVLQFAIDSCIDRLIDRAAAMRDHGKRWAAEVTMKTLKEAQEKTAKERGFDLLGYLASCGLIGLYFGIESVDESVELKKKITNEDAILLIRYCRSLGISVLGAFVLGISPTETPDYAKRVLDFAIDKANLDLIQVSINTPLPGSANFIEAVRNGTLRHTGWQDYDGVHCVFNHANMSLEELEFAYYYVLRSFYGVKSIAKRELWPHSTMREYTSHLWTLAPNAMLCHSSKRWPRMRVEESKRRHVHELEPEVLAQVTRAIEEKPSDPRLFRFNKPNDGISILI